MRINKYLAKTGLGSRRQCDEIIKNKLFKVNGQILNDFSLEIKDLEHSKIQSNCI